MSATYTRTLYHELQISYLSRPETLKNAISKISTKCKGMMCSFEHYATMILGDPAERANYDSTLVGKPIRKQRVDQRADYEPMQAYISDFIVRKDLGAFFTVP